MVNELARQSAVHLWDKIMNAVSDAIDRRVDRRRVVDIDEDGAIWVASLDPEVDSQERVPRLRGVRVETGDDVLLMSFGGTHTIIGAVRMAGDDPTESEVPAHTHQVEDIVGLVLSVAWGQVTGKPTSFPPSPHSHTWNQVTGKPTTFTPAPHAHLFSEMAATHRVTQSTVPRVWPDTGSYSGPGIGVNQQVSMLTGGANYISSGGISWAQIFHQNRGVMWVNSAHLEAL